MKKYLIFFSSILSIVILFFSNIVFAKTNISDNQELNWYFVNREKGKTPEAPKESVEFFKDYDAYYVGDTNSKVLYYEDT